MTTPSDQEATVDVSPDAETAVTASPELQPSAAQRDWHALAAETGPAGRQTRRRGAARPGTGPNPGQLSFGDLARSTDGSSAPVEVVPIRPAGPEPTRKPASVATGVDRGVLVAGRFPPTVKPSPTHRPRPGDWATVGVEPATKPFELPAPSAWGDDVPDRTLPVFATQVLEQRLGRLRAGQTLDVEPGEYRGTLTIRTPVMIRVAGEGEVRIRSTTGPAVLLRGCGATLRGLTLRSEHSDAIVVESAAGRRGVAGAGGDAERLELDGCRITAARSGIVVGTALVRLGVERCGIVAGDGSAVRLPMGAVAALAGSAITSAGGPGISGESGVTVALSGCHISGCGGAGIRLGEAASLWMDDGEPSALTGNRGSGIALGRGGRGALHETTLSDNGGWGLVAPDGDVLVRGGSVKGNALGDISV